MKKWLKILLAVVAALVLGIAAVFYFTSGIVETADSFLKAVKERDIAKARSYLAEEFKASMDEKALTDFLSRGAILNFKESNWSNRHISGGRGELKGSVTTETNGVVPINMMFVKENGKWKIYAIQKPTAGLQPDASSLNAPAKSDQAALVKQSIHDFAVSVKNKNMEHFRRTVSHLWQKQHTTEKLNQAFKAIIDSGADWTALDDYDPVLAAESKVGEDGVLVLKGYYATKPVQVHFEQKYVYEGISWKLIGFNIEAKK
jgi:hypothetical protein